MDSYEAMYIVKPKLADGDVKKIADRFKAVVEERGGNVSEAGIWEKRKLAYSIRGNKDGIYVLMKFEAKSDVPQELSRLLRIHEDVIRHRIYRAEAVVGRSEK